MTWRADDPQGNESAKVRHELVPYIRGRCLDLGCGGEKVWPHFIGVDNGLDAKLFGSPIKADMMVDSCESLPVFGTEQFDCVYSSHLLEHIVDFEKALAEWWRLVKPGGYLALYLPHRDHYPRIGQPGANPDHKHDFAPEDIINAMGVSIGGWDLERNETRSGGQEYSFLQVYRKRRDGLRLHPWAQERPAKTVGVVRMGALGDALWASSVIAHLKDEGYHVTVYAQEAGELMLRHDPHVDRIIVIPPVYDGAGLVSYFLYEAPKYDRWENLIGIVETRLLPAATDVDFWRTDAQRKRLFGPHNYLEALHDVAGVPHVWRQKFYPTREEAAWALAERAKFDGPVAVIAPTGSTASKWWPHVQACIDRLAAKGVRAVVLGDLRGENYDPKGGAIVGTAWPVRKALAFAQLADAVIGTESVVVNAVAFEPMLKVVLLSHSSHRNLTQHWMNTAAVEPIHVPCHPCHRIHRTMDHCMPERNTGAALCQAAIPGDQVADVVIEQLAELAREAA
jgi:ADP-heptose:LPS heptosyltransferase/predicted SAM-dependent methyltransferase